MIDENETDVCTVVSCMPFPVHKNIPHVNPGFFFIPEVKDGFKDYAILHVGPATCYWYAGNELGPNGDGWINRRMLSRELAEAIARDEIHSCINITAGHAQPAITFFTGRLSKTDIIVHHAKVLDSIREMQKRWFVELVRQADIDFAQMKSPGVVSELQRKAAKALNLRNKPWDIDAEVENVTTCPMCASLVSPAAIICMSCNYVLNKEVWAANKDRFIGSHVGNLTPTGNERK
jgi:hypothetical protein